MRISTALLSTMLAASVFSVGSAAAAPAGAVKNVVLVHGSFADGSGGAALPISCSRTATASAWSG